MLWPHIHKTTPCVSQLTNYGGASHPAGKGSTPRPWFQRYAESLTLSAPGTLHALHPDAGASSAAMHTWIVRAKLTLRERACLHAMPARSPDAHAAEVPYVGDRLA